jgi:integrase
MPKQVFTVADALTLYESQHVASPRVVDKQRCLDAGKPLRRHALAGLEPSAITDRHLLAYEGARASGALGRRVCPGTIRRELQHLSAALHYAKRQRALAAVDLPVITLPAQAPARDYVLTVAQLDALQAAAQPPGEARLTRVARFVALARYTAARRDAILGLTWDRVDLTGGTIDFRDRALAVTKKRRVHLPIAAALWPVLAQAKRERISYFVLDNPGSIRTAWETAARRAGVPDAGPHTLRHTWATHRAREGVSLWEIAGVLGDTVETVTKNYAHHSPDYLRGAVNSGGR